LRTYENYRNWQPWRNPIIFLTWITGRIKKNYKRFYCFTNAHDQKKNSHEVTLYYRVTYPAKYQAHGSNYLSIWCIYYLTAYYCLYKVTFHTALRSSKHIKILLGNGNNHVLWNRLCSQSGPNFNIPERSNPIKKTFLLLLYNKKMYDYFFIILKLNRYFF
jgi:hypothetical protein